MYTTSNTRERGRGTTQGDKREQVEEKEGLTTFNKHLILVGLVGREQPEPSVLGRGTLAVSQAAVLASPYRGGRLGGRI